MNNNQSQYNRMINRSIPKLIIYLSIPTIISMLITNIYNLVDTAFVGRLGTSASGAVGIVFGFMAIIPEVLSPGLLVEEILMMLIFRPQQDFLDPFYRVF